MKIKNKILKVMLVAFVAVLTFSCTNDDDNKEIIVPLKSILDIAKADPNFSILVAAIKKTGLDNPGSSPLSAAGSYTVFAPTNNAFLTSTTFTEASINALTVPADNATIATLKQVVLNHILGSGTRANDLVNDSYVKTFAQYNNSATVTLSMYVTKSATGVSLNGGSSLPGGANVVTADVPASNGIIHIVDKVILLPTVASLAKANPNLSTLATILASTATGAYGDQSSVLTTLSGTTAVTLFAPLNSAFTTATATGGFLTGANATPANITKILRYHVSNGALTSSSATSWTSSTATTDATITTLAATAQTFKIEKGTVKITELPVQAGVAASLIKLVNVQASNGVLHTIDRVLQPILP